METTQLVDPNATTSSAPTTAKMKFLTIPELKIRLGVDGIDIVRNPNSKKLFANTAKGNYKVEGALDLKLPIRFMYVSEETFGEGCIVNVAENNNVLTSL